MNLSRTDAIISPPMIIRPATPDDVPAVLEMVRKINQLHQAWDAQRFGLKGDPAESFDGWLRQRCHDADSVFLVAQTEHGTGGLAAYLVGTIEDEIPIYLQPRCGWIHDLWVEESYRFEGLGRQMAMLAVEYFGKRGIKQVRVQTATANDAARRLFGNCGFRACTVEMLFPIEALEEESGTR